MQKTYKRRTVRSGARRTRRRAQSITFHRGRVGFLMGIFIVAIVGVGWRLWFLQIYHADEYRNRADRQHITEAELVPQRGTIFVHDGDELYPVATNKAFGLVYVSPKDVAAEDYDRIIALLKEKLGEEAIDEARVRAKLAKSNDPYEVIARRVDENVARSIADARIAGLRTVPEVYRFYPAGEAAAQTIGFVGSDGKRYRGRYGIEQAFNDVLAGKKGYVRQLRDATGRWITLTDRVKQSAQDGANVVLTLDHAVQYEVEKILQDAVEQHKADGGSVIVMRPDGTILAMANVPRFDPNTYNRAEDIGVYRNPIISDAYESGSVMKAITMAIGIDTGVVTPQSTYVDAGVVKIGGYNIHNSEDNVYGLQTMTQVLDKSINTGVIHVERLVGHRRFAEYMERFGFGSKTGIELPGESAGNLRNLKPPIKPIQFYTASFGQGITVTLLQLAQSYAAIANGGMLMAPRIVDRIISSSGQEIVRPPREIHRVMRDETARSVRKMLESVVLNGHGKRAKIPGYRVGGKTGTAQVAKRNAQGYDDSITIGSFAGLAPIDNPQFVIVVRINNPKDVQWAESTAGPVFQKVMRFLLDYYNVPPTESVAAKGNAAVVQ